MKKIIIIILAIFIFAGCVTSPEVAEGKIEQRKRGNLEDDWVLIPIEPGDTWYDDGGGE